MRWKAVQRVLVGGWANHDECRNYYMEVPGFCRLIVRRRAQPGKERQGLWVREVGEAGGKHLESRAGLWGMSPWVA